MAEHLMVVAAEHPKNNSPVPQKPFGQIPDSSYLDKERRRQSGNLPDQPADMPVEKITPFKVKEASKP